MARKVALALVATAAGFIAFLCAGLGEFFDDSVIKKPRREPLRLVHCMDTVVCWAQFSQYNRKRRNASQ